MRSLTVRTAGKAFGVIQLDTQDRHKKFVQDDLKLLMAVAGQAAIAWKTPACTNKWWPGPGSSATWSWPTRCR